jgi:5-methylcytosine-specific restriction endonuclease McrA
MQGRHEQEEVGTFQTLGRTFSPAQRAEVVELKAAHPTWGPARLSAKTGIPRSQIAFWLKSSEFASKRATSTKALKYQDWASWRAAQLRTSWRHAHIKQQKAGLSKEEAFALMPPAKDIVPSTSEIRAWLSSVDMHCAYCGKMTSPKTFQADHALPVARGGKSEWVNLRVACKACNGAKGDQTEREFRELLGVVRGWEDGGKALLARLRRGNLGSWGKRG